VSFRTGGGADVPAVVPMINEAYLREAWLIPPPRTAEETLTRELALPEVRLIVAEVAAALAGCVRVRLLDDGAWFGLLATAVPFQGRGLASMLIERAEQLGRDEGFAAMRLECAGELGMPPYYESLGYTVELVEPGAYFKPKKGPFTRIVMKKELR
jgi:GNAT superfamily N-acetyltransferase